MNILLVNPFYQKETRWVTDDDAHAQMGHDMLPLGLATVAALTPERHHVQIWDEPIRGALTDETAFDRKYDLVGITGYRAHLARAAEISALFRRKGIPTVIGGPGASGSPDRCEGLYDVIFVGEAEETWAQFLEEFEAGRHQNLYRQIEKPDLAASPVPRWDSIVDDFPKYAVGCVQTTRGCPFDCEFCDVIYLYGRRQRHKPIENVLVEVEALEQRGIRSIFFCDDEFVGDPPYAKALLKALIPLNNSFARPLTYSTQLTMNVSKDDEMLELLADANFNLIFIGVETPNKESLKETGKFQNIRQDMLGDIHKVLSYGMGIRAGTIVGFDHDDLTIFDRQYEFLQKAFLPSISLNMLKAAIGTRLWTRLRREGRVLDLTNVVGHKLARVYTNIVPAGMSRVELMTGFRDLMERVYSWPAFAERMCGWVSVVRRKPRVAFQPVDEEQLEKLPALLKVEPEGEQAMRRIFAATLEQAPFMMYRIRELVIQHARYRASVRDLLNQMDEQIRLEESGRVRFSLDTRPVPIPQSFQAAFAKEIFPPVYRRLYLNVARKKDIPAALTEVFVDFLARWGESFDGLDAHHHTFLNELADRTAAKFNGVAGPDFVPVTEGEVPAKEAIRSRLHDDVLKSVEQELVKLIQASRATA
jgi:radical SAM superfamily enzyme YgiQ (UPF0313 family)